MQQIEQLEFYLDQTAEKTKKLRHERDEAVALSVNLSERLDERELQLMQFEEDAQGAAKLFEEERTLLIAEKEQLQARIDRLVNKIKGILTDGSDASECQSQ